ncbi:hypothetical protein H2200_001439 [Cladophialophora chaetospira]|uniref:AB hydrolase-1 domain-containing protein n=1 Tax=Cladophialophora chaetospira TaxID=386627 RepID=A0AA38XKW8_9EURO|nr:hypothetical protein H2200_001439 [Cladophialophora chaetospira]
MKSFSLSLANEAEVSGISSISPQSSSPHYRPLVVALHGGTYSSSYFAAGGASSALHIAEALGVPFIAIDRPGYRDSTALPPITDTSTFLQEEGIHLHRLILPAIWSEYGSTSKATTIVVLTHSLGSPGAIIAAALHAGESGPSYPYGGLIMSGWGIVQSRSNEAIRQQIDTLTVNGRINWPLEHKDAPMFGATPEALALRVSPEILSLTAELDNSMSRGEIEDGTFTWPGYWRGYAEEVKVPIMYSMAEHDGLWNTTAEHVEDFASAFTNSKRVERGIVAEAPHCMELSYWGPAWIARSLGFAMECAAAADVQFANVKA